MQEQTHTLSDLGFSSENPLKLPLERPERAKWCWWAPPLRDWGVAVGVPPSCGRLPTTLGVSPAAFHICACASMLSECLLLWGMTNPPSGTMRQGFRFSTAAAKWCHGTHRKGRKAG